MKILSIFLLLANLFFSAFCQGQLAEEMLFKRIIAQDSGFLQKREVFQISAIVNIIDSVNKIENDYQKEEYIKDGRTEEEYSEYLKFLDDLIEKKDTENDTIAKYYKRTDNGNYVIAVEYCFLGYYCNSNILIEISSQGKLLKKEIYYHCYSGRLLGNFNKFGDFFGLKLSSCSMGGYYIVSLCIFKEIAPVDSLNQIPFWCYTAETDDDTIENKHVSWGCDGTIKKIENDSLIISYFPKAYISEYGEDSEEIIEKEPFDILYIYKNNQWHVADKGEYEKLMWSTCFYFENEF